MIRRYKGRVNMRPVISTYLDNIVIFMYKHTSAYLKAQSIFCFRELRTKNVSD